MKKVKKFYLITNSLKDPDNRISERISRYLESKGGTCVVRSSEATEEGDYHYTDPSRIPEDIEGIIVTGGDGTLLQAARDVVYRGIPLLGINLGHLGYLSEVDTHNLEPALDKLLSDDYVQEERMMLVGTVYREGRVIGRDIALNDIVIVREGPMRVIRLDNYVNNEYLNSYDADGIILATPTGSTGYSLSCGGPIVSPSAVLTIMTPIAPHALNTRSMIFPGEDVITVELGEGRKEETEKGLAVFDGDTEIRLLTGDRIVIRKAAVSTKILKLKTLSFVEVLRQKMRNS